MKNTENERFIEVYNLLRKTGKVRTKTEIAKASGKIPQIIYDIFADKIKISSDILISLEAAYGINKSYILWGEEPKLLDKESNSLTRVDYGDVKMIPLLPMAAQGGSLNDFIVSVKPDDCEKIVSPIKGAEFAMTVSGDSMEPEYPSGAKILLKRINERAFIEWGRVYVLDTCNGSVIKKIMPGPSTETVTCVSLNEHYPPFDVSFGDMYGMYRVLMLLSEK